MQRRAIYELEADRLIAEGGINTKSVSVESVKGMIMLCFVFVTCENLDNFYVAICNKPKPTRGKVIWIKQR